MSDLNHARNPVVTTVGENLTLLWGMTSTQRLERIARAQDLTCFAGIPDADPAMSVILANASYVFDPAWLRLIRSRPGTAITINRKPFLVHCRTPNEAREIQAIMLADEPLEPQSGFEIMAQDEGAILTNDELRKRETPFAGLLAKDTVRSLERQSYFGAYKGVTDILTKYLWPEWALVLTRLAARSGIFPNMVTGLGALFCILATVCFWYGWFWTGMATGLAFMVLDTVDGKLARCTITSSAIGNVLDHGIDLVHPPFWWWAWGVGLAAYGLPLSNTVFSITLGTIIAGYVLQRLVEGYFMRKFGMHIHVWRPFDSQFRLITARRNPNMVLLFISLLVGRPDLGLFAIAIWTVLSLLVHIVQLFQALALHERGFAIRSWLA